MGSAKSNNRLLQGIGASPGITIGQVRITDRRRVVVNEERIAAGDVAAEIGRFKAALIKAKEELLQVKDDLAARRGPEHLYVLDTHLLILDDSMLARETVAFIEQELINAEAALKRTLSRFKEFFAGIEDEYLRERSGDVEIVVERI